MNVTAGSDSVNKKQTNSSVKRSRSMTKPTGTSKYLRTRKIEPTTASNQKVNVRDYFLHQRPFANLKIQLNQQILWCDKALLAAASPVLCEQLLKSNSQEESLSFDDIDLEDFLLFLEFIYPLFNPQINPENISSLLRLAHRFQFDVLKHACQFYMLKYLSAIRRVVNTCHHFEAEGDGYVSNNNDDDAIAENESLRRRDLIEFHDGTCIDASDIIFNLCQWLETYFYEDNLVILQSILSILQQITVDHLDRVLNSMDISDQIKGYIYKERAQYLEEEIHRNKQPL